MQEKKRLGILGGLGPMASVIFYKMITEHTKASCDQDHLDVIVLSGASTPDRTEFITGKCDVSPLPQMIEGIKLLENAGAEIISVPCNTAHFFYDELNKASGVPVLNIVELTTGYIKRIGAKKVGLLATDGTILSGSYKRECDRMGLDYVVPDEENQKIIMDIIYNRIKNNNDTDPTDFFRVAKSLKEKDCDCLLIGCTELSLIPLDNAPSDLKFVDSLEVLAKVSIEECGCEPIGFDNMLL